MRKDWKSKELEPPETTYVRDIEMRALQSIILNCLSKLEGVFLIEEKLVDTLLGRECVSGIRGIHVDQDKKSPALSIKVEIKVAYGLKIPQKVEEVQNIISEKITELTSLPIATVHVVVRDVLLPKEPLTAVAEKVERKQKASLGQ